MNTNPLKRVAIELRNYARGLDQDRTERAIKLFEQNYVTEFSFTENLAVHKVRSSVQNKEYWVSFNTEGNYSCQCQDHIRGYFCKHLRASVASTICRFSTGNF